MHIDQDLLVDLVIVAIILIYAVSPIDLIPLNPIDDAIVTAIGALGVYYHRTEGF